MNKKSFLFYYIFENNGMKLVKFSALELLKVH